MERVLESFCETRDHRYIQFDAYRITAVLKTSIIARDSSNAVLVFDSMENIYVLYVYIYIYIYISLSHLTFCEGIIWMPGLRRGF